MSPADAEARRRERGVIAQRAYRKRHASKVQTLQDENRKLRDALAEIQRASQRCDAVPDPLRAALSKTRDLAGIGDALVAGDDGGVDVDDVQQTAARSPPEQPARPDPSPPVTDILTGFGSSPHDEPPGGTPSPRLDYGLWLEAEHIVRAMSLPMSVVPYIGARMHTMAGFMFWSTMHYTIDLWNSRSAPQTVRHLDRIFSHPRPLADGEYLASMVQVRLDYEQKGYMFRKLSEQFERNAMGGMYKLVGHDYEARGMPTKYWKTPEEVAENLLGQLNPGQAARFQAVVEGRGTRADEEMMGGMALWLVHNFVCFGTGPRWSNISVSVGIGSWIAELANRDARAREALSHSVETPS